MAWAFRDQPGEEKSALLWREYRAIQLTAAEKADARAEVERRVEAAAADGVYERVKELAGTVKWESTWQQLRLEDW